MKEHFKKQLENISFKSPEFDFDIPDKEMLYKDAGQEHYKLLARISDEWGASYAAHETILCIADLGTRYGHSAIAASYNNAVQVDSYDINPEYTNAAKDKIKKPNISFFCENVLTSPKLLEYDLIVLDVDPHDGIKEEQCLRFLLENKWCGAIILDDIADAEKYPKLNQLWNELLSLLQEYYVLANFTDLTEIGHASGTGFLDIIHYYNPLCPRNNAQN